MIEISKVKESESEELCGKKGKLFCELTNELDLPEVYTVMTAIRGCDFEINTHKRVFTARIRYLVFGDIVGGMLREKAELTLNDILGLIFEAFFVGLTYREGIYDHYIDHVQDALRILRDLMESEETRNELIWLFDLTVLLRDVSGLWGFDAYEKIRTHIASFINLGSKAKVEIKIWRTPSEPIKELYKKKISIRDIISAKFFSKIREVFITFLEAMRMKNYDTGLIDFVVAGHLGRITVKAFHVLNSFPELTIIIETGKEGDRRWKPSI